MSRLSAVSTAGFPFCRHLPSGPRPRLRLRLHPRLTSVAAAIPGVRCRSDIALSRGLKAPAPFPAAPHTTPRYTGRPRTPPCDCATVRRAAPGAYCHDYYYSSSSSSSASRIFRPVAQMRSFIATLPWRLISPAPIPPPSHPMPDAAKPAAPAPAPGLGLDPQGPTATLPKLPFRFETGIGLFAKDKAPPFPPPFLSPPSDSFSDPLSTYARPKVNGQLMRGVTNGDDAVYAGDYFICANDGVGVWSKRPRGHAGLWSRLILHYWVCAIEQDVLRHADPNPASAIPCRPYEPDAIGYLEEAHASTMRALTGPAEYFGTTTATGAQLHFRTAEPSGPPRPVVHVTNIGDSQVLIIRPSTGQVVFRSEEQWHWFDCPRQLGSRSKDTARKDAKTDAVDINVGDVVLAMSDGVIDNLWGHEVVDVVLHAMERWEANEAAEKQTGTRMEYTAQALLDAAKAVATDVYAESPYMERAIDMGATYEGGKRDDISVVAAQCVVNE